MTEYQEKRDMTKSRGLLLLAENEELQSCEI